MRKLLSLFLILALVACASDGDVNPIGVGGGTSQGGSLASFLIAGDNLYVLANDKIVTYNISDKTNMKYTSSIQLPSLLETVYLYENYLFLGSNNSVYFLDLSNGDTPKYVSSYAHVTACDPVVARNNIAYTTIRSTNCRGIVSGQNLLEAIDISDLTNPKLLNSAGVEEPYGLAINNDFLFVCESRGITSYNISNPTRPVMMSHSQIGNGLPYDIILKSDYMIVVTSDGIYNATYDIQGQLSVIGEITE